MKIFIILFVFLLAFPHSAEAHTLLVCKKRNPSAYTSYLWVEINSNANEELSFQYGNGIDTQMLDVYLNLPVEKTSESTYQGKNENYSLKVSLKNKQLSFVIQTEKQTIKKSGFICP